MIFSLFLVFLASIITGICQVLLKIGSARKGKEKNSALAPYLNLPTITAYGLFLFVTVIVVIALKDIQLKVAYAVASLSFVTVLLLSFWILKEKITKKMVIAIVLIVLGITIFNISY